MINQAVLSFRAPCLFQLLNDVANRRRSRAQGSRAIGATQGPHTTHHCLGNLSRQEWRIVLSRDKRFATNYHLAGFSEVKGNDRDVLGVDVFPDVELSPVGQREYPNAFALLMRPL